MMCLLASASASPRTMAADVLSSVNTLSLGKVGITFGGTLAGRHQPAAPHAILHDEQFERGTR